tara:strand:+ start:633 stop:1181 length:549 start_codon:yes stop_codon:yes gene_type:complete
MENIKFQVDGYLEGGFPIEEEDIEIITGLEYYYQLVGLIETCNTEEAIKLVNENLDAEFIVENIEPFEDEGFEFLDVKNVSAQSPFIEEIDGVKIPLFKSISATFTLEGPKEIIINWMDKEGDIYKFNEKLFEDWLDKNGGDELQDGCSYNLDGACYDLRGFGSNACSINQESIDKAFNLDN